MFVEVLLLIPLNICMISWPRNVPLQQVLLLLGEALMMEKRVEDDRYRPVRLFVVFLLGHLFI